VERQVLWVLEMYAIAECVAGSSLVRYSSTLPGDIASSPETETVGGEKAFYLRRGKQSIDRAMKVPPHTLPPFHPLIPPSMIDKGVGCLRAHPPILPRERAKRSSGPHAMRICRGGHVRHQRDIRLEQLCFVRWARRERGKFFLLFSLRRRPLSGPHLAHRPGQRAAEVNLLHHLTGTSSFSKSLFLPSLPPFE
jgi:hypothetical protein